ncbi:MAG TPA: L-histidine N(alpha)-methyltransferase [Candidatus Limnocylindrales bacterium]|nr:L-histidine N(alpha)-methyltransferase [Candidatus Limnocylindrales bacterium]
MRSASATNGHPELLDEFAADVRAGLGGPGQKTLPSRYLYDDLGSALFEAISFLPEYGLTRADERIVRAHAREMAAMLRPPVVVAELGSGSGRKTRWILEALARLKPTVYYPIDISSAALQRCAVELGGLASVRVEPIEDDYLGGLTTVTSQRKTNERLFLLFLGSTIGNFERDKAQEFLGEIRARLLPGDAFLLGTDLVKPPAVLLAAYDDPLGVTAAFNLNLLRRLNRELDADFDLALFEHEARWDAAEKRVDMHIVARRAHKARIKALDLVVLFRAGESIWTESSYKYEADEPIRIARRAKFEPAGQWRDLEWPFAESLFIAR